MDDNKQLETMLADEKQREKQRLEELIASDNRAYRLNLKLEWHGRKATLLSGDGFLLQNLKTPKQIRAYLSPFCMGIANYLDTRHKETLREIEQLVASIDRQEQGAEVAL